MSFCQGGPKRHFSELSFRHVTTKSWAYSRMFGFFRIFFSPKIKPYPGRINFWKYNGKFLFWFLKKYWPKLLEICLRNKNMAFLISNLLSESIFDFGKWSNGKSVWPLSEVENWFWKKIWNEKRHISILIFFWRVSVNIKKKSKNGFPIVFSKSDSAWVGFYFWWEKKFWRSQTP